jgi:hypothetical protein
MANGRLSRKSFQGIWVKISETSPICRWWWSRVPSEETIRHSLPPMLKGKDQVGMVEASGWLKIPKIPPVFL